MRRRYKCVECRQACRGNKLDGVVLCKRCHDRIIEAHRLLKLEKYEKFIELLLEYTTEDPAGGRIWHYEDISKIGGALLKGDFGPLDYWLED